MEIHLQLTRRHGTVRPHGNVITSAVAETPDQNHVVPRQSFDEVDDGIHREHRDVRSVRTVTRDGESPSHLPSLFVKIAQDDKASRVDKEVNEVSVRDPPSFAYWHIELERSVHVRHVRCPIRVHDATPFAVERSTLKLHGYFAGLCQFAGHQCSDEDEALDEEDLLRLDVNLCPWNEAWLSKLIPHSVTQPKQFGLPRPSVIDRASLSAVRVWSREPAVFRNSPLSFTAANGRPAPVGTSEGPDLIRVVKGGS